MQLSNELITKELMEVRLEVTEIGTNVKYIQKKVDENSAIADSIHSLSSTVQALASTIDQISSQTKNDIANCRDGIKRMGQRIEDLEKEPGRKWKAMTAQITGLLIAAIIGAMAARFMGGGF